MILFEELFGNPENKNSQIFENGIGKFFVIEKRVLVRHLQIGFSIYTQNCRIEKELTATTLAEIGDPCNSSFSKVQNFKSIEFCNDGTVYHTNIESSEVIFDVQFFLSNKTSLGDSVRIYLFWFAAAALKYSDIYF